MNNFLSYYFKEESNFQVFNIPTKIRSYFKIVGGLDNYKNWKSKVLMANSAGDGVKKGDWESPRYVLISLDSNNIIPVAISDEHQTGYGLLEDYYYAKKLIKRENYISIDGDGATYLYGNSLDVEKIEAFKKWLSYGGENQTVRSVGRGSYIGDMEDVIEKKGNVEIIKGKLFKPGQKIINTLEELGKEYSKFLSMEKQYHEPSDDDFEIFINKTISFIESFKDFDGLNRELVDGKFITYDKIDKMLKKFPTIIKEKDWRRAADTLFTFNGIKNLIHNKLRQIIKSDKGDSRYIGIFGDVELAYREFERLAKI